MLFGRRKPGFVKEEENPELVSEYNEDRMIAKQQAEAEEKPYLMEYLESLPEVEDPYAEAMAAAAAMPQPEMKEKTKAELLADFIRERSAGAMLTAYAALAAEEEALETLLQEMRETESCADIVSIKGDKDVYYYSNANMSDNYARIAMLVEEKNLPKTIAEMVRFSCKTYPSPTPLDYFTLHPYFYTMPQIKRAVEQFEKHEEYADMATVVTGNNITYLYSKDIMSEKYAKALAEGAEYGEYGYRR